MIVLKVTMSLQDKDSSVKAKSSATWNDEIKFGELEPDQQIKDIVLETLMRGAISTSKQLIADTAGVIESALNRYQGAEAASSPESGDDDLSATP